MSLVSNCASNHEPRSGMIRNEFSVLPFGCLVASNATPGERCNWLTITRSAPLITKLPCGVINGISPMNTRSSLVPFSSFRRKITCNGEP